MTSIHRNSKPTVPLSIVKSIGIDIDSDHNLLVGDMKHTLKNIKISPIKINVDYPPNNFENN